MGISGLWDVVGQGEVVHIAEYARRFFEEKKRPLRIAVDEACWRFNNLTPEQVEQIRQSSDVAAASNPVEKTILWRTLRLLKLNIQLIFVTDGPGKPGKERNHGKGQLVERKLVELLHRLFTRLGVPYHSAPGEAEAECARMQELGIVDAVWSDDGDAFMFGARLLLRQHKGSDNKAVKDYIRVYSMDQIEKEYDMDKQSLLVFTVLCGGDYAVAGLKGVGGQAARVLAKRQYGLGPKLQTAEPAQMHQWRQDLRDVMQQCGKGAFVPEDFPKLKALNGYRNPNVSRDFQLHNMSGLKKGWAKPIDLQKLRIELRERYNFDTKQYLNHVGPVMLARSLHAAPKDDNLRLRITLKRQNKERPGNEMKITFNPQPLFPFDLLRQPPGEDWNKTDVPYDPSSDVECEVLQCLLDHGLPAGSLEAAKPAPRKRKAQTEEDDGVDSPATKKSKSSLLEGDASPSGKAAKKVLADSDPNVQPKPRKKPISSKSKSEKNKADSAEAEPAAASNSRPPPKFRHLEPFDMGDFGVVDLTDAEDHFLPIPYASQTLKDSTPLTRPQPPSTTPPILDEPDPSMQPGKAIDPAVLRALRLAALPTMRPFATSSNVGKAPATENVDAPLLPDMHTNNTSLSTSNMGRIKSKPIEIIDLT